MLQNTRMLILKGHSQNLTSGQGHVRSHGDPSSHVAMLQYQAMRLHEIITLGPCPALYPLSIKSNMLEKHASGFILLRMTRRRAHWAKIAYGSSRVALYT